MDATEQSVINHSRRLSFEQHPLGLSSNIEPVNPETDPQRSRIFTLSPTAWLPTSIFPKRAHRLLGTCNSWCHESITAVFQHLHLVKSSSRILQSRPSVIKQTHCAIVQTSSRPCQSLILLLIWLVVLQPPQEHVSQTAYSSPAGKKQWTTVCLINKNDK